MTRKQTEHDTPIYRQARAELLRDEPLCHWCHRNTATELDHLVPHDAGGTLEDGYVASCKPCNSARGATYQNRKLANAKQNREKAINNFLYSTTLATLKTSFSARFAGRTATSASTSQTDHPSLSSQRQLTLTA
jgi:5-methylcytosine-specific restriction endonuclease McrA